MAHVSLQFILSRQKVEAWLAAKLGTRSATIADLTYAENVLWDFLNEHGIVKGVGAELRIATGNSTEYNTFVTGDGDKFAAACRLLEQHFLVERQ